MKGHRFCSRCGKEMVWAEWSPGFDRNTGARIRRWSWVCKNSGEARQGRSPDTWGHDGPGAAWGWAWDDDLEKNYRGYIVKVQP